VAGNDGNANLAGEFKLKSDQLRNVHDCTIKNSGEVTYDFKAGGSTQVVFFNWTYRNLLKEMDSAS